MKVTKHEQALIHEVMEMAYEQGIEEGERRILQKIKEWYRENFVHGKDK